MRVTYYANLNFYYAIICLWLILALNTMPKPIIVANIDDPP